MRRTTIITIVLVSVIILSLEKSTLNAVQRRIKTKDGKYMRFIRGGSFIMGSGAHCEETPRHRVRVKSFYLDETEVTFNQFKNFIKHSGYVTQGKWKRGFKRGWGKHPVTNVTYKDAVAYAKWAGKRLPTQSEWEYAAGGPRRYTYSYGPGWSLTKGATWHPRIKRTRKVRSYRPNGYGLYDMTGNVMEWTSSKYLPYPRGKRCKHMDGNYMTVKGGCYLFFAVRSRRQARHAVKPSIAFTALGFRCAKEIN